jgi:hypothetical protein
LEGKVFYYLPKNDFSDRFNAIAVSGKMMPCRLVKEYQGFEMTCSLHSHDRSLFPQDFRFSCLISLHKYLDGMPKKPRPIPCLYFPTI